MEGRVDLVGAMSLRDEIKALDRAKRVLVGDAPDARQRRPSFCTSCKRPIGKYDSWHATSAGGVCSARCRDALAAASLPLAKTSARHDPLAYLCEIDDPDRIRHAAPELGVRIVKERTQEFTDGSSAVQFTVEMDTSMGRRRFHLVPASVAARERQRAAGRSLSPYSAVAA